MANRYIVFSLLNWVILKILSKRQRRVKPAWRLNAMSIFNAKNYIIPLIGALWIGAVTSTAHARPYPQQPYTTASISITTNNHPHRASHSHRTHHSNRFYRQLSRFAYFNNRPHRYNNHYRKPHCNSHRGHRPRYGKKVYRHHHRH